MYPSPPLDRRPGSSPYPPPLRARRKREEGGYIFKKDKRGESSDAVAPTTIFTLNHFLLGCSSRGQTRPAGAS